MRPAAPLPGNVNGLIFAVGGPPSRFKMLEGACGKGTNKTFSRRCVVVRCGAGGRRKTSTGEGLDPGTMGEWPARWQLGHLGTDCGCWSDGRLDGWGAARGTPVACRIWTCCDGGQIWSPDRLGYRGGPGTHSGCLLKCVPNRCGLHR